jgi:hypothetical protein
MCTTNWDISLKQTEVTKNVVFWDTAHLDRGLTSPLCYFWKVCDYKKKYLIYMGNTLWGRDK